MDLSQLCNRSSVHLRLSIFSVSLHLACTATVFTIFACSAVVRHKANDGVPRPSKLGLSTIPHSRDWLVLRARLITPLADSN